MCWVCLVKKKKEVGGGSGVGVNEKREEVVAGGRLPT